MNDLWINTILKLKVALWHYILALSYDNEGVLDIFGMVHYLFERAKTYLFYTTNFVIGLNASSISNIFYSYHDKIYAFGVPFDEILKIILLLLTILATLTKLLIDIHNHFRNIDNVRIENIYNKSTVIEDLIMLKPKKKNGSHLIIIGIVILILLVGIKVA